MAPKKTSQLQVEANQTQNLKDVKPIRTPSAANRIMRSIFNKHALPGWKILFSETSLKRSGSCSHYTKTLRINKSFAVRVLQSSLVDTILHEIAHMLAGETAGHGPQWKKIAKEIGCTGKAEHEFEWAEAPFVARCPTGRHEERRVNVIRWKRPLACERCGKWLLYFRPGRESELVEFGGKDPLAVYHLEYEKKLAEMSKSQNGKKGFPI
jgi:SprT protein